MAQPVLLAPLNTVRAAVHARLSSDANTSGYNLAGDASGVAFPYLAISSAYRGTSPRSGSGVDPTTGVNVVVQVDAYALASQGGANKVQAMMEDVALALSAGDITISVRTAEGTETSRPLRTVIEDDVLNPTLVDSADGQVYAQRFVRFRFLVIT